MDKYMNNYISNSNRRPYEMKPSSKLDYIISDTYGGNNMSNKKLTSNQKAESTQPAQDTQQFLNSFKVIVQVDSGSKSNAHHSSSMMEDEDSKTCGDLNLGYLKMKKLEVLEQD